MKNLKAVHSKKETWVVTQIRSYQWPLPLPQDFAQYEEVLPWSANRILTMAEQRSIASIEEESKAWKRDFIITWSIILSIITFCWLCLWFGIYFILLGKDNMGIGLISLASSPLLTTLVRSFFTKKQ